ncbi:MULTISPECIES: peptidylprolyl isomerase [Flavobacteriales]|uniref:Peptidyl-prolyl cis-trans isomerase SurA n=1 Tax=Aequorivita viscosa TaxID=797419 RepID=A0A1M6J4H3_9FLAO|nr:peptidylprolyl isomerase [Aequorivita viscosa]SDX07294.1 peptidyl-prolyl cis-trans isomerase SurA [Aequorivita viscosa]SHJ41614.1 peptidyl-prolyl cis-trans isomerase SurA [Aequorivita viscosa]
MKNFLTVLFLVFLGGTTIFSQNKKDVLLTIDGTPVYANEFKRVYEKNLELVQDESQKDIDGYLQLFIDYKLKIFEAKAQGLDEGEVYKAELTKYRDQLSRNYLFENKFTEDLAKEAYDRGKEEINANHILIKVSYEATPQDTLAAYNKIKSIREKALKNGADFEQLAKENSEEPNAKSSGGKLGYFSVFNMVYPFETAAYNTKVGAVSEIVRTNFGYHIIKVNDRRERLPKVAVSHIMISDKKGAKTFDPKERINEISTMLKQGQSFENLAKEYSDDKNSGVKGGALKPFTKGELRAPEFEEVAYQLKNIGDISEPVKTDFGWHIIRLDEIVADPTFEEQRVQLEKKVKQGDRGKVVINAVNNKIKEIYGFKKVESYLPFFDTYVTDSVLSRKWKKEPIAAAQNKTLFTIGNKAVKYSDFASYIEERQGTTMPFKDKEKLLIGMYDELETNELKEYFRDQLEIENEEYAAILGEYRDGLLIFDVMDKNIWSKAKNDTIGLQNFYNKSKENYRWKKRLDVDIFSATSQIYAQRVQKMIQEGMAPEDIKTELNPDGSVNVLLTQGVFEIGEKELPENLDIKKGVSSVYPSNDSFTVVNVKEILPESIKDLEDVKGRVISNYQNELETTWMNELHAKYKVEVNSKTLRKLKRRLK